MQKKPIRYNLGDPEDYNPITLSRYSEKELRDEYTRLRKIARDRLRRIEKSEDFADSLIVRNNKDWLSVPPSSIPAAALPSVLSQTESFLRAKTSTLTGLKKARALTIESLKASGIRGVNTKNFNAFTNFMNKTKLYKEAYIPYPSRSAGSEAINKAKQIRPRMFRLTEKENISEAAIMKEFQFFRDNLDRIEKLVRSGDVNTDRKRPYSANELRRLLGMEPEQARTIKQAQTEARNMIPSRPPRRKK